MSTTNTQSLDLNENRQGKFKQIQSYFLSRTNKK